MSTYDYAWYWHLSFRDQEAYEDFRKDPLCHDVVFSFEDPKTIESGIVKWEVRLKRRTWKSTLRLLLKDYPEIVIDKSRPQKKKVSKPKPKRKEYSLNEYVQKMEQGITVCQLFQEAYKITVKREFTWLSLHKKELLQIEEAIAVFIKRPNQDVTENIEETKSVHDDTTQSNVINVIQYSSPAKKETYAIRSRESGKRQTRNLCIGNWHNLERHVKELIALKYPDLMIELGLEL